MSEKDIVLDFFDLIAHIMEEAATEVDKESEYRKQCSDLAKSLWAFMEEMMNVGFNNKQAFALLQSIVIDGVTRVQS